MKVTLPILLWAMLSPTLARAQEVPFQDGRFTLRSADNDPDLILVRERFDPATHIQSLYLRVFDGVADFETFSGVLTVQGAEIVQVLTTSAELLGSDVQYAVPGMDYGTGRGLEGEPSAQVPIAGSGRDAIRLISTQQLRFWISAERDLDDLRVLIRYPAEPGSASFGVQLFHAGRPDPQGWPLSNNAGIQVGSLERDVTPDDGDYSEVYEISRIKLLVEDFDIAEVGLFLGEVDQGGGILGPELFHLENDFGDVDADQDNGFDQNGLISPIPTALNVDHLLAFATGLDREGGGGEIPASAVTLGELPPRLQRGERLPVSVEVTVPPGLGPGLYRGSVIVYEDNNQNGSRQGTEPADAVRLTVVVGSPPDAAFDLGLPVDLGVADALPDVLPDTSDGPDVPDGADALSPDVAAVPDAFADGGDGPHVADFGDVSDCGPTGCHDGGPGFDAAGGGGLGSARGGALSCQGATDGAPLAPLALLLCVGLWLRRRSP